MELGWASRSFHPVVPQIGDRWSAKEARAGTPFAVSPCTAEDANDHIGKCSLLNQSNTKGIRDDERMYSNVDSRYRGTVFGELAA